MYFRVGIISKLASYFVSTRFFHGHTSKRLAYCANRTTDCCVVAFGYRMSRLTTFVQALFFFFHPPVDGEKKTQAQHSSTYFRAFVVCEKGRALPNNIITPVSVLIRHPRDI